jgi:hypothetical protein
MPTKKKAKSKRTTRPATKRKSVATKKRVTKKAARSQARGRINFMPNDPGAAAFLPLRIVGAGRESGRARFAFEPAPAPAAQFAPGTDEFLFWQSRQAALAALQTFEWLNGPLAAWATAARSPLPLFRNAGIDLNAYYDRDSVSFFEFTTRGVTTFSGASTDVVAHEVGHALLDAIRPDLWTSNLPEHGAFHEAFGDCIAILTAFEDRATCRQLVASPRNIGAANFVEATAEDLSAGVRRELGAGHPASQPRHAFNNFRWRLPSSLPTTGGPAVLTGEVHSFARVFTGCFYDTIRFIFNAFPSQTAVTLREAARTAGTLLVVGTQNALEQPRFFQAVGEGMLSADATANGGQNQNAILSAFNRHGISLATPDRAFHERSLLTSASPRRGAATTPRAVQDEIRRRYGSATGARAVRTPFSVGAERMEKFVHRHEVDLTGLSERLAGVVAAAPEPVVVGGARRGFAAVRSAPPDAAATETEVRYFVETLLDRKSIAFDGKVPRSHRAVRTRGAVRTASAPVPSTRPVTQQSDVITHVVRYRGGKKVLERVRFACRCHTHG